MLRGGFFATQNYRVQCSLSAPKAHDGKKNYYKTESHIDICEGVENKVSFIGKNVDIQYITPVHRKTVIDQ
jgi:hypothetical protein